MNPKDSNVYRNEGEFCSTPTGSHYLLWQLFLQTCNPFGIPTSIRPNRIKLTHRTRSDKYHYKIIDVRLIKIYRPYGTFWRP